MTVTCFFVLETQTDFDFFCIDLKFELGTGNISALEWPPKPSYASSGLAAAEELSLVRFGFLNMLNLSLPDGNCRFILREPFRGVRPKLQDLIFRYGDAGSDCCCGLASGDSRLPNWKDTIGILYIMYLLVKYKR